MGSTLILANILTNTLAVFFVLSAALLVLVILIQKPKGGGLAGAFGGGGGGGTDQAMFGARSGDVLTWITVGLFVAFLLLAISLVFATRAESAAAGAQLRGEQTEQVEPEPDVSEEADPTPLGDPGDLTPPGTVDMLADDEEDAADGPEPGEGETDDAPTQTPAE